MKLIKIKPIKKGKIKKDATEAIKKLTGQRT